MRHLIIIATLLLLSPFAMSDVVFHEEFDDPPGWWGADNPPTGWQIHDFGIGPLESDWHQCGEGDSALARICGVPTLEPMSADLFKDDIDCSDYENLELSYWLDVSWMPIYYYPGTFLVYGSNDQFNDHWITLLAVYWDYDIYSTTMVHDISLWADGQPTMGVWFRVQMDNSYGLDRIVLDEVHIEGDYDTPVQPSSLGKVKALYQ